MRKDEMHGKEEPIRDTLLTRREAIGLAASAASVPLAGCLRPVPADNAAIGDKRTVRILATSDLHGKMLPWNYPADEADASGSMAQLASAIAELRDDHTLLVDVGDTIQDNMADLFLEDEVHPMIACLNQLHYDVGVTGNHDYNFGMDVLRRAVAAFEGKVLTGNVIDENGDPVAEGYAIFTIDGIRVGVIGMVTPNIQRWDAANLVGCVVTTPADEARKIIDAIKDEVDVLVAAVHMHLNNEFDIAGTGVRDLVAACPEFDVVLAGHGHVLIEGEQVGNALVVENKYQGQSLAVVELTFERMAEGWDLVDKSSSSVDVSTYEADPDMVEFLAPYDERAKDFAREVVGKLEGGPLAPEDEIPGVPMPLIQDTALVDLVNETQLLYSGADISVSAPLAIGANIQPGEIRRCDVAKIYKFSNTLYTLRMTGAQIRTILEWSASAYRQWQPGDVTLAFTEGARIYNYLIPNGVTYQIDVSKEVGSRILNLAWANGTPVADDDTFVVATDNYKANTHLLAYGDLFAEGQELPELLESDLRSDIGGIREMIIDYIQNVAGGTITPEVDGNWSLVGNDWDPARHERAVELVREGKIVVEDETAGMRLLCTKVITEADLEEWS